MMGSCYGCPDSENDTEKVYIYEGAPLDRRWYHGGINSRVAEQRLKSAAYGDGAACDNGVYLVYDDPRTRGNYILLAMYERKCVRWNIVRRADGTYILGMDGPGVVSHSSVRKLIEYHRGLNGRPIKVQQGGTLKLRRDYAMVP